MNIHPYIKSLTKSCTRQGYFTIKLHDNKTPAARKLKSLPATVGSVARTTPSSTAPPLCSVLTYKALHSLYSTVRDSTQFHLCRALPVQEPQGQTVYGLELGAGPTFQLQDVCQTAVQKGCKKLTRFKPMQSQDHTVHLMSSVVF